MEKMNVLTLIITLVVGVILTGALLGPVIDSASATEETITNDGYTRMAEKDGETVITWTPSENRNVIQINGEEYALTVFPTTFNTSYSIAFADDFVLRVYMDGAGPDNIQIWQAGFRTGASKNMTTTATFTITPTSITYNSGAPDATTSTYTHSGNYYLMDNNGNLIMKNKNDSAYLLEDSSIVYAGGISFLGGSTNSGIFFTGTVGNYTFTPMDSTVSIDNPTSTFTEVDKYKGVIALSNIQFDTTTSGGTTVHQTYSYFLVPYQITAELSEHLTPGQISLIGAIPVMVIVALLMAAVGAIALRRAD